MIFTRLWRASWDPITFPGIRHHGVLCFSDTGDNDA
jgi:hypothetical protein